MERLTIVRIASLGLILVSLLGLILAEWSLCRIVDTRFSVAVSWSIFAVYDGSFRYGAGARLYNNGSLPVRVAELWVFVYILDPNPYGSKRYLYEASLSGKKFYNLGQEYLSPGRTVDPGESGDFAFEGGMTLASLGSKSETVVEILSDYGNSTPVLYVYAVLRAEIETPGGGEECPAQLCLLSFESGPAPKSPSFGGHG